MTTRIAQEIQFRMSGQIAVRLGHGILRLKKNHTTRPGQYSAKSSVTPILGQSGQIKGAPEELLVDQVIQR
jgi:hypothetical protein